MVDVSITKEAAAQRQIDAAIRMLFLHGEDLVAVHTVAAAARTVVQDIASSKGVGHLYSTRLALEMVLREALNAVKRSSETGSPLELEEAHRNALAQAAHCVVPGLFEACAASTGTVNLELGDLDPANPKIAVDLDRRSRAIEKDRRTKAHRNKVANFLKHADEKHGQNLKSLNLGDVDVLWVIADGINMWMEMNLPLTDEMRVYSQWFFKVLPLEPEDVQPTKAGPAHLLTFQQQIGLGRFLLKDAYTRSGRSLDQFRDDTVHNAKQLADGRMFTQLE